MAAAARADAPVWGDDREVPRTFEGHYNKKYIAPKDDPLDTEKNISILEPTPAQQRAEYRQLLMDAASGKYGDDAALMKRAKKTLARMKFYDLQSKRKDDWAKDFQFWLVGKSKWNDKKYTPWGNKDMLHLDDVRRYIDGFTEKRFEFHEKLVLLNHRGESRALRSIDELYLYYKYIVRGWQVWRDKVKQQPGYDPNNPDRSLPFLTYEGMLEFLDEYRYVDENANHAVRQGGNDPQTTMYPAPGGQQAPALELADAYDAAEHRDVPPDVDPGDADAYRDYVIARYLSGGAAERADERAERNLKRRKKTLYNRASDFFADAPGRVARNQAVYNATAATPHQVTVVDEAAIAAERAKTAAALQASAAANRDLAAAQEKQMRYKERKQAYKQQIAASKARVPELDGHRLDERVKHLEDLTGKKNGPTQEEHNRLRDELAVLKGLQQDKTELHGMRDELAGLRPLPARVAAAEQAIAGAQTKGEAIAALKKLRKEFERKGASTDAIAELNREIGVLKHGQKNNDEVVAEIQAKLGALKPYDDFALSRRVMELERKDEERGDGAAAAAYDDADLQKRTGELEENARLEFKTSQRHEREIGAVNKRVSKLTKEANTLKLKIQELKGYDDTDVRGQLNTLTKRLEEKEARIKQLEDAPAPAAPKDHSKKLKGIATRLGALEGREGVDVNAFKTLQSSVEALQKHRAPTHSNKFKKISGDLAEIHKSLETLTAKRATGEQFAGRVNALETGLEEVRRNQSNGGGGGEGGAASTLTGQAEADFKRLSHEAMRLSEEEKLRMRSLLQNTYQEQLDNQQIAINESLKRSELANYTKDIAVDVLGQVSAIVDPKIKAALSVGVQEIVASAISESEKRAALKLASATTGLENRIDVLKNENEELRNKLESVRTFTGLSGGDPTSHAAKITFLKTAVDRLTNALPGIRAELEHNTSRMDAVSSTVAAIPVLKEALNSMQNQQRYVVDQVQQAASTTAGVSADLRAVPLMIAQTTAALAADVAGHVQGIRHTLEKNLADVTATVDTISADMDDLYDFQNNATDAMARISQRVDVTSQRLGYVSDQMIASANQLHAQHVNDLRAVEHLIQASGQKQLDYSTKLVHELHGEVVQAVSSKVHMEKSLMGMQSAIQTLLLDGEKTRQMFANAPALGDQVVARVQEIFNRNSVVLEKMTQSKAHAALLDSSTDQEIARSSAALNEAANVVREFESTPLNTENGFNTAWGRLKDTAVVIDVPRPRVERGDIERRMRVAARARELGQKYSALEAAQRELPRLVTETAQGAVNPQQLAEVTHNIAQQQQALIDEQDELDRVYEGELSPGDVMEESRGKKPSTAVGEAFFNKAKKDHPNLSEEDVANAIWERTIREEELGTGVLTQMFKSTFNSIAKSGILGDWWATRARGKNDIAQRNTVKSNSSGVRELFNEAGRSLLRL